MRNKRFPISKTILSSFSYRFLVHDNANKTKRGKTLRSEIRKLSRASICCSKRGKKKKTTSTLRKHFESELSYLWFSTERNFGKEKVFLVLGPKILLSFTTGTQLLLHDSVIYDDDHPTSSFRESERTKHQQQQSSEQQSFHLRCFNVFQDDRMFTPEKDGKQKQKKIV